MTAFSNQHYSDCAKLGPLSDPLHASAARLTLASAARLTIEPKLELSHRWLSDLTGYQFKNPDLLHIAITHSSAQRQVGLNYERMEFLGDRILNLWVTDLEVRAGFGCQGRRLGKQSEVATFVSNQFLSNAAVRSGLTELGVSPSDQTFLEGRKAAGDLVESVAAAIYLDSGSIEHAGGFLNSVLSHVRTYKKFLTELPVSSSTAPEAEDLLFLPKAVRHFVERFGFQGRGDRFFSAAILSQLSECRHEGLFADLYGLGNRAHQLLCGAQVYYALEHATESELSRQSVECGKEVLRKVSSQPPWAPCAAEMPEVKGDDPAVNRQRYHALIGAVYRLGGLNAVHQAFGELYYGPHAQHPPPTAPLAMIRLAPFGASATVA